MVHVASTVRADHVFFGEVVPDVGSVDGYAGVLACRPPEDGASWRRDTPLVHSLRYRHHLEEGDVVALHSNGYVRTLYRRGSNHNAVFATDRCNSYCLMCSQPPRSVDDSGRIAEHLRLVDLIDPDCPELGITGGEPTLLGYDLLRLIAYCRERLPSTALHLLSNGRLFAYASFARDLAAVRHPDLMIGIPLYAAVAAEHDHVVQARGAFSHTVLGIQNLGRFGLRVEIRIVVHRLTAPRLGDISEFVYRNLPFAAHVTFMGLEMMGFAVPNEKELWIDPWDYRLELEAAVRFLADRGLVVSVYNHPLCLVPKGLWPWCRRSISDWKNDFLPECESCAAREACGGLFASSLRRKRSEHIHPFSLAELIPPAPGIGVGGAVAVG